MTRENKIKKVKDLTSGPLLWQIIGFTLPLILTAVLQLLFNTADTVVVGRFGGATPDECETALAAVGSCGALINLIVNLFFGLSVGAGVCVAHAMGAKDYPEVDRVVHTSVLASLICSVFVTVFGLLAARPLLTLMGTDPSVLDQAVPYMRAYFWGMPANMLYNYCAAMLRSKGDTIHPLIFLSTAGAVNVVFNLIMVIVFGLGALGVGIATAVSQWISCILTVGYMMRLRGPCHISLRQLKIDGRVLRKIVFIGLPAGLQGCLFSLSNVLIQSSVNSFGKVVVAGNTAASNLDGYIYATQNSLYHTALTFVGQNLGAKKYKRMKQSVLLCVAVVTIVGVVVGLTVFAFGHPLLRIYAPENAAVVEAGMRRLRIMCLTYFLCGVMEVGCGVLRALGRSITPMLISLTGSCVFRIVWIYTIFRWFRSLEMLYISYPISWTLTAATHFLFCAVLIRRLAKDSPEPAPELAEQTI